MGLWTTIVNTTKTVTERVTETVTETITKTAKWAWSWTYRPLAAATIFAVNTIAHILAQGIALKDSVPALASPQSLKIVKAATHITLYQIAPLILLNLSNNYLQALLRPEKAEENNRALYQNLMISASTVIDWGVWLYISQRSSHMLGQTLAVDTMGAAAFNADKPPTPESQQPCETEGCNFKRKIKGSFREFFVLFFYDVFTGGVSYIPYAGEVMALLLKIGFSGDTIARSATLGRCERHRTADPSLVTALGLCYVMAERLMDHALTSSVGIPPYLVHRTMRHLLFLSFANNATYMDIKYVASGKGTLPLDPIVAIAKASGFFIDMAIGGFKGEITKLFKASPDKKPFITLENFFKELTVALNSDLEKENQRHPGFFKTTLKKAFPPIYRSTKEAVHDPVLSIFWPDIRELALEIIEIVETVGKPIGDITKTDVPLVASTLTTALPKFLYYSYGISTQLTESVIKVCSEDDFWGCIAALNHWLLRHNLRKQQPLAPASEQQLASLHERKKETKVVRSNQEEQVIMQPRSLPTEVLKPTRLANSEHVLLSPHALLSRKRDKQQTIGHGSNAVPVITNFY